MNTTIFSAPYSVMTEFLDIKSCVAASNNVILEGRAKHKMTVKICGAISIRANRTVCPSEILNR